jgi:hypothetical protein
MIAVIEPANLSSGNAPFAIQVFGALEISRKLFFLLSRKEI